MFEEKNKLSVEQKEQCKSRSHSHWVQILTSEDVMTGNHKHTHYISGNTDIADGHYHTFTQITTLDNGIFPEREEVISPAPKTCKYKYNPLDDEKR